MIEFLNINVFFIILIPLLALIVLTVTNKSTLEQHFSKEILEKLQANNNAMKKNTRNILMFLALIFFVVALARPVITKEPITVKQKLIPLVIAVDVSKSMLANDIFPNRLTLAKKKLKQIINKASNMSVGVVLFAKDSFILSPVTEDFVSLNYIVDNFNTDINLPNGSNLNAVLEATTHMLSDYKVKNLVVLSDGANEKEVDNYIEFANENDISIYSIGLATKQGAPIPLENGYLTDKNGDIVRVKLNEAIKDISLKTNGGYIDFTLDNSDVEAIVNRINAQSKKEELENKTIKNYKELFYYPLAFGILVFFISVSSMPSFRNRANVFVVILSLGAVSSDLRAFEFEFKSLEKAKNYYEKKEFTKASDEYRKVSQTPQSLYNLANSVYKDGKYEEAINLYEKIVTDDKNLEYKKLHNLGNSFVKTNDLQKAKEFYEKALKLNEDKQTRENLELVNKELEKKNKENQNKQNKNSKDDKSNKNDKNKQNKEDNQNKQNNKEQEKKENNQNKKESQKQKNNNSTQSNKEKKEEQKQKEKASQAKQTKQNQKAKNQQAISDIEEQKWLKKLQEQKTPIYLQKVKTSKGSDDEQPW